MNFNSLIKSLFSFIIIFVICLTISGFITSIIFLHNPELLPYFGEFNNFENAFAPVNTFFSALAVAFTLLSLHQQSKLTTDQQIESNFFKLLEIHTENKKNIKLENTQNQNHPFEHCYHFLNELNSVILKCEDMSQTKDEEGVRQALDDFCNSKQFQSVKAIKAWLPEAMHKKQKDKFIVFYAILIEIYSKSFSRYYHHLYRTIKYIDQHAPEQRKKEYYGLLRAQLSHYEHIFLYYHCLTYSKDENKFKNLVEKHSLNQDLEFMNFFGKEFLSTYGMKNTQGKFISLPSIHN